jgi:hypothetical protein
VPKSNYIYFSYISIGFEDDYQYGVKKGKHTLKAKLEHHKVLEKLDIEVLRSINSKKNISTNKLNHNRIKTENMKTY